ncbi:hypothetical protein MSAN_00011200 [Mycena sanguinolenta]|uniref:F-box domain-containing protein n=1 Tax=Mycena sanguinolenta TaxID=230812 RepID=A0A8H6ZGQ6_9AGAR|nr:hypothetical protein MSAN_00011200 [Mycena sanguinolenta]
MGKQGFRAGVSRFFRSLLRVGSGERETNTSAKHISGSTAYTFGSSEESTLVDCDAICHIQRLPDPVLGAIFALSKDAVEKEPPPRRAVRPVERVVSQVAVRWRVVALGLPELWSSVDARVRPDHQRTLLEWYLTHAENRPLDVSISLSQENWDTEGKEILRMVLAEVRRLRRLAIRTDFLAGDTAVREACQYVCAPVLEHLSLISLEVPRSRRDPGDYIYDEDFGTMVFTRGLPRLAVLRLQHLEGAAYPPLDSVTTLHLEEYHCPPMAHTRLSALIRAMPALVNLSLYGCVVANWPMEGALYVPHLRALRCALRGGERRMLDALNAPVLEELTLKDVRATELWGGFGRRLPALRKLTLDGEVDARALATVFRELGSVEELWVVNCGADRALRMLALGGPGRVLLGLRKVMVHWVWNSAALDSVSARGLEIFVHDDVPWAGGAGRWTALPPWPTELDRVDPDDLFMQLH